MNVEPSGAPLPLRWHHYAIAVANLDDVLAWYMDKLNFTIERRFGFPESSTEIVHIMNAQGLRIEILARDGAKPGPDVGRDPFAALMVQGAKHIGFLVDDLDATVAELEGRGVAIEVPPTTVVPAGVKNFWIRDPAGTLIEFDQWLP